MNRGWECPKCGKILAPWVESCDHTIVASVIPSPACEHVWVCEHVWASDTVGTRCSKCGLSFRPWATPATTISEPNT